MDKNIIYALTKNKSALLARKSFINCHCEGVDSLMLFADKNCSIRMFIANTEHALWKNYYTNRNNTLHFPHVFSVGFHNHKHDLTLECVHNSFVHLIWDTQLENYNLKYQPVVELQQFEFSSKILGGTGTFNYANTTQGTIHFEAIIKGDCINLPYNAFHTIHIPQYQSAAWIVYEHAHYPDTPALCYSNDNLENFIPENLYLTMPTEYYTMQLQRIFNL